MSRSLVSLLPVLVSFVGCSGAPSDVAGDDGGVTADGGGTADGDASDGEGAVCPTPSTSFTADSTVPHAGDWGRRHAVLQVADGEAPRVIVENDYQFGASLEGLSNVNGEWEHSYLADDNSNIVAFNDVAARGGADPCVAYTDGTYQLHIQCDSLGDRIVAPNVQGGPGATLQLARDSGGLQFIYADGAGRLVWTPYTTAPGSTETIDDTAFIGPTALAVDASGTSHVAYASYTNEGRRLVVYATRGPNGWMHTTLLDEPAGDQTEADSVAMTLVGDQPAIAYHHLDTGSLDLARRESDGTFTTRELVTPPAGFPGDSAGLSIAMQLGCTGELHIVYSRTFTTDPVSPQLVYGRVTATGIVDEVALPDSHLMADFAPHGLAFYVAADGHQVVAAEATFGAATYYATR